jgi:thioredoxin reductase
MTESFDLAIVGGGPAGQAAAEQALRAGLRVVMFDEQQRLGGQILRQPSTAVRVGGWMRGRLYRDVRAQLAVATALDALVFRGGRSVLGIFGQAAEDFEIVTSGAEGGETIVARRVLIAAGCFDMPVALPGWTLPGVMSAGGAQAFIKGQQFVPGDRFVLAGTHPLQLIVADQLRKGGGKVAAVLFAQSFGRMVAASLADLPSALRHAPKLAAAAFALLRLRLGGVPVRFGRTIGAVRGERQVEFVSMRCCAADGTPAEAMDGHIACDRVALCFGFLPQADLPRMLGCDGRRDAATGGWAAGHDDWMRSSVPGVYVAGETTGVAGADVALMEGRIAGLAIAMDAGAIDGEVAGRHASAPRRRLRGLRGFAALLARIASPEKVVPALADDATIVCRCEDVTLGALRAAAGAGAAPGQASALKLVTRAGMGLCQGRSCEAAVMRALGGARGNDGGFTARFPARPVALHDVAERC